MSSTDPALIPNAEIPVVIVAGGMGMRLREETERVPKPMVRIGEKPIIWHIMKHYSTFGFRRFTICLGYKGWALKEYFLNYREEVNDIRIQLATEGVESLSEDRVEDWEVTLVETGLSTGTSGRIAMAAPYLDQPHFMYTYGDGVGAVDIDGVLSQHHANGNHVLTMTGVRPQSRWGILTYDGVDLTGMTEKPEVAEGYVNGGFYAIDRTVAVQLADCDPKGFMELDLLPRLAADGVTGLFRHHGFWHSMDTYRDFTALNEMWDSGDAPWKSWED